MHELKNLLTEAAQHGLELSSTTRIEIELLDEAHSKFWHRYPREEAKPVFVIDQFERPVGELLRS